LLASLELFDESDLSAAQDLSGSLELPPENQSSVATVPAIEPAGDRSRNQNSHQADEEEIAAKLPDQVIQRFALGREGLGLK
jgi:hypothetical protein